jgi:hypothetical protein
LRRQLGMLQVARNIGALQLYAEAQVRTA